jgi:hypothetical protein
LICYLGAYCFELVAYSYLSGVSTLLLNLEAWAKGVLEGDLTGVSMIVDAGFCEGATF